MIRVLGVDPGTHRVGWGVIEGSNAKQKVVAYGCIESKPGTKSNEYLQTIEKELSQIIESYQPHLAGIETLLFQKNVKTAITVAGARGVILLTCAKNSLEVVELAPNTIKSVVAGSGSAKKPEVTRMVGLLLGVSTDKMLDDTTDALAIGISALVLYKGTI